MLTVEAALEQILKRVRPLETERVDLVGALGRALAETIVSTRVIPPWPNSSMDGYAVRAADTGAAAASGHTELAVVGKIAAGALPARPVRAGEAMRIFTGAPLPDGADAVVPQEDVEIVGDRVRIGRRVEPGAFVRPVGEDVRHGDVVLEPGHTLRAAEIGMLATLGYARVTVVRRPRVAILSTGNELADLGTEPGPGQIPNTNTYSLIAQVLEAGAEPINLGVAGDQLDVIGERLGWGQGADALVSSAGVSVGELDHVKDAMTRLGAELHLWRVSMRPGKPITFGSLGERPVFGLPGNPVSAMVTFELFVRPALLKMQGRTDLERPHLSAVTEDRLSNPPHLEQYFRGIARREGDRILVRLTGDQGSHVLRSMADANCLIVVSQGTSDVPVGATVDIILLGPIG